MSLDSVDDVLSDLRDDSLQAEIELVGDLVVAATSAPGRLSEAEIDRLLGVAPASASDEPDAATA